ncbi:phage terminase small subunit [Paenibacillus sp. P96]|uniref:Phage terminase small subunit n=1 Tax=Paenibacillus zeirhizosphaerae TaxID=2987519 RepID=A0ABT9FQ67_9BACL|nr:phage terminase small subunit [Paenibacillus sp. P96]MDP4096878.1 phage terminase small subunit [Paenibacillus sp. P96]
MADKHILAEQDYQAGLKYKEIAEKYEVSLNTVKSWKQRHGWNRDRGAPSSKGMHTKRPGAPPGNQNAKGNRGGSAPKGNSNAVTHGLFAKYLPDETREILQQLETRSPLDMLWDSIVIQHAAIIRAQQLMYVRDQQDTTTTLIEEKNGDSSYSQAWEVQQAWDKHAAFLQAQSRAMATLQSLIKRYEEMCRQGLADNEQQLRIQKLKGEVALLDQKVAKDDDKPIEIVITRKGERP